jgi:outer membrane protein
MNLLHKLASAREVRALPSPRAPHARMASMIFLCALIFTSITVAPVAADDALDIQTARALVLANSAAVSKAQLAVTSAELALQAQRYDGAPSVSASLGGNMDYGSQAAPADGLGASLRVGASQTLYDGGRQSALLRNAALALEAARQEMRALRVDMTGQADAAFYAVVKAQASVDAADDDRAASQLRLNLAKAKAEAGVIARSDYLQAESEAASYGTALIKARKTLSSASAKLASLTGKTASVGVVTIDISRYGSFLEKSETLDEAAAGKLVTDIVALAAESNPSLAMYALAARKAGLSEAAARAGYLPTVAASLSHAVNWENASGLTLGAGSVSLTATVNLDVWKSANSVASAKLAATGASIDEADAARVLALDIEVAVNELLGAARAIGSSTKALEYAQSNYEHVLERYRLSAASASNLSTALALVSSARTALIGARYDFLSYLSSLRGLAGLEGEEGVVGLVP